MGAGGTGPIGLYVGLRIVICQQRATTFVRHTQLP